MRLLVCGGRHFGVIPKWARFGTFEYIRLSRKASDESALLDRVLTACEPHPCVLIHGAAQGADTLAARWARRNGIPDLPFKADWYPAGFGRLDKSAGPRRNAGPVDSPWRKAEALISNGFPSTRFPIEADVASVHLP